MNSGIQYGIRQDVWSQILGVLAQQPKITQIKLFGSRAKGNFKPVSDIDLCIDAEGLSLSEKFALENELDDLLLPWKLDLAVWQLIDQPALKEHIERVGIELPTS
jgi:predicted nucleotidyltransferase